MICNKSLFFVGFRKFTISYKLIVLNDFCSYSVYIPAASVSAWHNKIYYIHQIPKILYFLLIVHRTPESHINPLLCYLKRISCYPFYSSVHLVADAPQFLYASWHPNEAISLCIHTSFLQQGLPNTTSFLLLLRSISYACR